MNGVKHWDVVIIGAGPAGCTAALYAAQGGLSVLLAEGEIAGGQMTKSTDIDNWPGENTPVDGITLGERMEKHAVRAGAKLYYGSVTQIQPLPEGGFQLNLGEDILTARHVILATGATPRMLGLPGENTLLGHGLSTCAACDGRLYRDKSVVIVGGGHTAVHDARYLSRICRQVTLVHRRDTFAVPAFHADQLRTLPNLTVLTPYTVTAYQTDGQNVTGVHLHHTAGQGEQKIACDGVFLAIGTVPRPGPAAGLVSLDKYGAVLTDQRCRTSVPGLYAVGDCRAGAERQIVTSCGDGCIAARTILES